jgi:hypothetical protein
MIAEKVKAIFSPCMNGLEIRWGKKLLPVMLAALARGRPLRTLAGISLAIGLKPRKAAKRLPTGGALATWWATVTGTPWETSWLCMVWGKVLARPRMMRLKKTPMDSTEPAFMPVARIPLAAPRSSAGTAFITAVVLGAANRPMPIPFVTRRVAKIG